MGLASDVGRTDGRVWHCWIFGLEPHKPKSLRSLGRSPGARVSPRTWEEEGV